MKIFAIKTESDKNAILAYLVYYEKEKSFYIELPENADPWETPLLLSSFAKKNIRTVNAYWSKIWVQQRIVPTDRQNLGQVLRENNLSFYDEFEMLMLSKGRCAQDDYYLQPIEEAALPKSITDRFSTRIEDVVPLEHMQLLVFFRDGIIKKCDVTAFFPENEALKTFLTLHSELFLRVRMQPGGHGVYWEENMTIPDLALYDSGTPVPLTASDFKDFVAHRVVNAAEAAELLGCSRQNINDLVKREKLHPIKATEKNTLFLKSELMQRIWK